MAALRALPDRLLAYELISYDPEVLRDAFTWNHRDRRHCVSDPHYRRWNATFAGRTAGCIDRKGYLVIGLLGITYFAHRLAWLLVHGHPVPDVLDHINHDPLDNRIANIRAATMATNNANVKKSIRNKTGVKGVNINRGKYRVAVGKDNKGHYIGHFLTLEEAAKARREAAERLHGEFVRHA